MITTLCGKPSLLAIESGITEVYEQLSLRALGFFVIYVGGRCYGRRTPDSTALACSFDSVRLRIARRGLHRASFGGEPEPKKIVDALVSTTYSEDRYEEVFFGMSSKEFRTSVAQGNVVWAPDGDSAFDDGGHVLHFDQGERVRVIAFKNDGTLEDIFNSVTEAWLDANEFYEILDNWQKSFEREWLTALKLNMS